MASNSKTPDAAEAKPTRVRLLILGLITTGTMINYLDRTVLGVAAPSLGRELHLDPALMGLVFSAFSWTYVVSQVPGGVFLDRFGSKITYFCALTFWSLFTLAQGLATGLASLLVFRFGLGVAEAPCFPVNSRVISTWFPQHERARATGIYSVGEYVGLAFLSPLLFWIVATWGWRCLFFAVGALGLAFGVVWLFTYREPGQSRLVNKAELDYIEAGGGLGHHSQNTRFSWSTLGQLLRSRQIVGASIGQFAGNCTLVFFLTWFPTYLATERHMGFLKVGIYAVLPFIAASVGVMTGGYVSDVLLRRSGSANIARKLPMVAGLLLASTIMAANFVSSNELVIAIMSVAFFGQGMVGLGWAVITDIAPKKAMGLAAGVFNLATNTAGIITPLAIGFIVKATGSFVWALTLIAALALVGAFSYVFVLGDVKRVELD
ncbi:MAG TPA: MFS transporter [Caulobacteraceae bacterium]|nr:MFS transporter [Caulobacteraceae bacterium]